METGAGTRGHLWAEMLEAMPMSGSRPSCWSVELHRQLDSHFESFLDSWSVFFPSPLWLIGSQWVSLRRVKNIRYGHHVEGQQECEVVHVGEGEARAIQGEDGKPSDFYNYLGD